MTTIHPTAGLCSSCDTAGRRGYCAPGRCYCGHETCHAYASWSPVPETRMDDDEDRPRRSKSSEQQRKSWETREDDTWLDKL